MRYSIFLLICTFLFSADDKAPRQRTRDRDVDIHHIKIDVTVNLEEKSVSGNVIHTLSAFNSSLSEFELDAEDMEIHRVRLNGKDISYNHHGEKVFLSLNKPIGWDDTIKVRLDYTAHPRKGTFFIAPDSVYPGKPWQAWTQGEDTDNHHWVPIYDYPNDKATFETILTVDKKFLAISNGELVSLKENKDGTHTWHWHEHFPMVSYLISYVIGEFEKVEDSYNGIPVNYWSAILMLIM